MLDTGGIFTTAFGDQVMTSILTNWGDCGDTLAAASEIAHLNFQLYLSQVSTTYVSPHLFFPHTCRHSLALILYFSQRFYNNKSELRLEVYGGSYTPTSLKGNVYRPD